MRHLWQSFRRGFEHGYYPIVTVTIRLDTAEFEAAYKRFLDRYPADRSWYGI